MNLKALQDLIQSRGDDLDAILTLLRERLARDVGEDKATILIVRLKMGMKR